MARTFKDRPYELGGDRHPHVLANLRGYPKHKRSTRRRARMAANTDLRIKDDAEPKYPVESEYYD